MLCRVCDQVDGSKWNFYGANGICHSCRGFFMRSVQTFSYKTFHQKQCNSKCVIQSKSRKSCKRCRFDKCLSVGMKTSYVKTYECTNLPTKISKPLELKFTADDEKEVLQYWDNIWNSTVNEAYFKLYASNEQHLVRHFTLPNWGIDLHHLHQECEDFDKLMDEHGMKLYAFTYFKLNNQSSSDAFKVLKHNFDRMLVFMEAVSYCNVSNDRHFGFITCFNFFHIQLCRVN